MAETILSYLLAKLQSSNPRKVFRKKWAVRNQEKTASLLYPVSRDGEWEDMAEAILSYLLAELESSNPQRISKKNGRSGIRRRRHLSYTLWVGDGEWVH
jgi:hypothetical protein